MVINGLLIWITFAVEARQEYTIEGVSVFTQTYDKAVSNVKKFVGNDISITARLLDIVFMIESATVNWYVVFIFIVLRTGLTLIDAWD